jgi:hypothetical protein
VGVALQPEVASQLGFDLQKGIAFGLQGEIVANIVTDLTRTVTSKREL